jgi:hypothetical protein
MSESSSERASGDASQPIHRGSGATASERILADLGDRAFLRLWSYPNLFIDKKKNNKGHGKELCDLLVVCGDDVIIFSDKTITWPENKPIGIAWPRFYRRAVAESVNQINGAARWLEKCPDRIFTDPACTQKLPVDLPSGHSRKLHGVVIANGAYKACQQWTKDDSGSFMILPMLKGDQHADFATPGFLPFSIGDPNPDGMFIHVFDNESIQRLLTQLDTITDFTTYLNKRATYLRSGQLFMAHGEEELLGRYMSVGVHTGEYDFEFKRKKKFKNFVTITIQGEWRAYLFSQEYLAKTLADEVSYIWDKLINLFAQHVVDGTSVPILGQPANPTLAERGIRFMALENRFYRRLLGEAVQGAMEAAIAAKQDRFTRVIMPFHGNRDSTLAYILMILAYPTELEKGGKLPGGYEQYRETRAHMIETYCMALLSDHPHLKTVVGIAVDASWIQAGKIGGSEDLMAIQVEEWTDELRQHVAEAREHYDVLQPDRLKETLLSRDEFPKLGGKRRP